MLAVKAGWSSLSDITDQDIAAYPMLCDTEDSGMTDLENGMEYHAGSLTGISAMLGLNAQADCQIPITYVIDGTDMVLALVKADGSVERFSESGEHQTEVSLPAGEHMICAVGYQGTGTASVTVESDQVELDRALAVKLTMELMDNGQKRGAAIRQRPVWDP